MRTANTIYAEAFAHGVGNPYCQLAIDQPITYPTREVRVLRAGWYGPHGHPVALAERFKMLLPDALGAQRRGLVEFVR